MSAKSRLSVAIALLLLSSCGGGARRAVVDAARAGDLDRALDAYETARKAVGTDDALLRFIAAALLEKAALGADAKARDEAVEQLGLAGTRGKRILRRIAGRDEVTPARARALAILARTGDGRAESELYALIDEDDPDILAAAIASVDPHDDAARLLVWIRHPVAAVRRAAVGRLAGAAPSSEALLALGEASRVDPDPTVRMIAVASLGRYGAAAIHSLRDRLGDREPAVSLSAVRALVIADPRGAIVHLRPLLAAPLEPRSVEAARVLASSPEIDAAIRTDARATLRRALVAGIPDLRAQSGVGLLTLPSDPELDRALLGALEDEEDPRVRLQLARALMRRSASRRVARRALEGLIEGDGMAAIQAASILAADGHRASGDRLERELVGSSPILRRVAARALARDARRPDAARVALRDPDAMVRIHAAGGILAR